MTLADTCCRAAPHKHWRTCRRYSGNAQGVDIIAAAAGQRAPPPDIARPRRLIHMIPARSDTNVSCHMPSTAPQSRHCKALSSKTYTRKLQDLEPTPGSSKTWNVHLKAPGPRIYTRNLQDLNPEPRSSKTRRIRTTKPSADLSVRSGSARGMLRPLLVSDPAHWYSLARNVSTSTSLRRGPGFRVLYRIHQRVAGRDMSQAITKLVNYLNLNIYRIQGKGLLLLLQSLAHYWINPGRTSPLAGACC